MIATTAVGDVDGDDKLEVVVNSRSGWLYAWHTKGTTDGVITWESFHHDNRNTGNLDVPLDQGKLMGAATPLELDSEGKCVQAEEPTPTPATKQDLSPEGGCGCSVPSSRRTPRRSSACSPPWGSCSGVGVAPSGCAERVQRGLLTVKGLAAQSMPVR